MIKKIPVSFILFILLISCSPRPTVNAITKEFPTPTIYNLFLVNSQKPLMNTPKPNEAIIAPTVANLFIPGLSATPDRSPTPSATKTSKQPSKRDLSSYDYSLVNIYDETLNSNWQILKSERTEADPENYQIVYSGNKSLKTTPGEDFSTVYFAVRPEASEIYSRRSVLGVKFKLNPGKGYIGPSNLAVAVVGSNQYSYFVPGDASVTNRVLPVFPETRLYDLGINQMIPPQTWVDVTIWMDDLIYDPVYKNVTGFYIKNDKGFRSIFYIDDVSLILDNNEKAVASPQQTGSPRTTPSVNQTGTPNPDDLITSIQVDIDPKQETHPISPMIYGISNGTAQDITDLRASFNSWGGNQASRYNWELGNAWNTGRDDLYQNTDQGQPSGSYSDRFIAQSQNFGAKIRISLPTLGWVAKNTNPKSCSFPLSDGSCGNANDASCIIPGDVADPYIANVTSNVDSILKWVHHIFLERYYKVDILALDNEPELWGITHYDVHPKCTTYQEIVDKYLEYALPIKQMVPTVKLAGPVTSDWQYYWDSAAGASDKQQHNNQDFLPWFLDQIKQHDTQKGIQTLDVLDIHYFPEGLHNDKVDPETATHRMRATRSLWDPTYIDESSIQEAVNLIPRMKDIIAKHYPGLELGISEWNFGAENNINGALAIADVLGIMGRENVYYANYWTFPPKNSPGAFAFQMYTNYDGHLRQFGDLSVYAKSKNPNLISAYASLNQKTGQLHLMIINKHPKNTIQVKLNLSNFSTPSNVSLYQYSRENLVKVISSDVQWPGDDGTLNIPPYSINHYILNP